MSRLRPPLWTGLESAWSLRIEVLPPGPETPDAAIEAEWAFIRARNPRCFNGPILAFLDADPSRGRLRVRRDRYKRLAVQPRIATGVTQLGVTGVLEASDLAGTSHVLLGLRSRATRIFGGLWEFGPSGGVDAPPINRDSLDAADVWRGLVNEIREELGLPVDPDPAPPIGLLADPEANSVDLVVRVRLVRPVEELVAAIDDESGTSRWEYEAVRWVAIGELGPFFAAHPTIPATVAVARAIGWIGEACSTG